MFSVPMAMLLAWLMERTAPLRLSAAPLETGWIKTHILALGTLICAGIALPERVSFLTDFSIHIMSDTCCRPAALDP